MSDKIKVIIVDDSAFMRKALKRMLSSDPLLSVVGEAGNGPDALQQIKTLKPNVVTLDVNMPDMNGIEVLKRIMREVPTPVLMVSSVTSEGAAITMQALAAGAVDFVDKSSTSSIMDITRIAETLIEKVKIVAGVSIEKIESSVTDTTKPTFAFPKPDMPSAEYLSGNPSHLVAIGASTGGPMTLEKILTALPAEYPGAILVVQHMPVGFTKSFSERLNSICRMKVKEAEEGDILKPGYVYIGRAGYHLKILKTADRYKTFLANTPSDSPHIPSVDVMMQSVAETWQGRMLGVILTGMGADGTEGLKIMKRRGAYIIGQNEKTCVVYGMPKAAYMAGVVDMVLPMQNIGDAIGRFNVNGMV